MSVVHEMMDDSESNYYYNSTEDDDDDDVDVHVPLKRFEISSFCLNLFLKFLAEPPNRM